MSLYYLGNSRGTEQLNEMRQLEAEGKCLFCPANLDSAPSQRVLMRTEAWNITENRYPYRGARLHLLVIPALHVSDILSLPRDVLADFWVALAWIKETYSLEFYGLGARCGDCRYTGGTIQHLHVHVVVGDVEDPDHEPVRLKLSSRPAPGSGEIPVHHAPAQA